MATGPLDHAFGVRGYQYVRTEYRGGQTTFTIRQDEKKPRRPACGSRDVRPEGRIERRLRSRPIGNRATIVAPPIPRVACAACHVTRQVEVPSADPRRSYTEAFERYAPDLSRRMTIRDVARRLGVSRDVVKDIQRRDRSRRYAGPGLGGLRRIAIDEIAVGKGHRYPTVALDPETGAVVSVGDGEGADASKPSWKRLRRCEARVEAVAMGMSAAYHGAVSAHLPEATVAFDHFHVVELFNGKLSGLRRSPYRRATAEPKEALTGSRWLPLKAPEDLDPERDEGSRSEGALALNEPPATAYYLEGDLRRPRPQPGKTFAGASLADGVRRAEASGAPMLRRMAQALEARRAGLPAYYDYPTSTGASEGTNSEIKTMKRQAHGSRDRGFFKLKIRAIHEARYALVG